MPVLAPVRPLVMRSTHTVPFSGEVDVRLVDLRADEDLLTRAELLLTPDEVARARRGTTPVHRRRVLLRAALRSALGAELAMDPASVPLGTTPAGRPFLAGSAGDPPLDVNCSASGGLGIVVVGRSCRVGVDVEQIAPWSPDVLDEGWLSSSERRALTELAPAARPAAVTRSWTQKEAVLKARGTGLQDDPAATVTVIGQQHGDVAGWVIQDVPVPARWIASLAVGPQSEAVA